MFLPPANFNRDRKNLNTKAMITYKRPITIGQKLTNYKHIGTLLLFEIYVVVFQFV